MECFDRVVVVDGGTVVQDGAPEDLYDEPDSLFARLLNRERKLLTELWMDPDWRRIRVDGGRLVDVD